MTSITKRVDAVTLLTPEYAQTICPPPRSVKIEITGRCNHRCSFCAHNQRLREVGEMDQDLFKRLVTDMHAAGVQELGVFYLGESFLCDWLPDAIKFAKDVGFKYVFLTTNGTAATPERIAACMAAGLDSLKFSLNYADEFQFAEVAQVKATLFDKIEENVIAASKARALGAHKCNLAGSYIAYDGVQGERMRKYVARVSPWLDEVYALPLYNQAALIENEDWKFVQGNRGRADALRDPLPCWSIFTEGHIAFDGRLSACCFDHDHRFTMGDLTVTPFMDAWNGEAFQALRAAHLAKNVDGTICEKCVAG
jgi:hypothetical protein